jgi:hypothetical protein
MDELIKALTAVQGRLECGLPHCGHIRCLVPVNIQQALMIVNGCNFVCMEEFNDTALLRSHFIVRRHFARLPLRC